MKRHYASLKTFSDISVLENLHIDLYLSMLYYLHHWHELQLALLVRSLVHQEEVG